jgi:hypothetical protein
VHPTKEEAEHLRDVHRQAVTFLQTLILEWLLGEWQTEFENDTEHYAWNTQIDIGLAKERAEVAHHSSPSAMRLRCLERLNLQTSQNNLKRNSIHVFFDNASKPVEKLR